jgi:hypothetical protein
MQVKPIQTLMHFAKNVRICIACATECENILTWNIAKNVQMLVVNAAERKAMLEVVA